MKKYLILCVTLVSSMIGAQASADSCASTANYCLPCDTQCNSFFSDGNVYVGGFAGANFINKYSNKRNLEFKMHPGYLGAATVGYQYKSVRVEAEVAFRWNELKKAKFYKQHVALKGHTHSLSYMANVYYDFDIETCFTPYLGLGLGYSTNKTHFSSKEGSGIDVNNKRHHNFAWQGIAGVSTRVSDQTDVALEYRYFEEAVKASMKHALKQQAVGIVVRYYF